MILADTNVVSEFMRSAPAPEVVEWAATIPPRGLVISVISIQEIEFGVGQLARGRRRAALEAAWSAVREAFAEAFVPYDHEAASAAAKALLTARRAGRPMHLADAQIAGTCLARGARLATRNTKDFATLPELEVVNPFET